MANLLIIFGSVALTCGFVVAAMLLGARWILSLVDLSTQRQNQVMLNSLEGITGLLKDAVITTVQSTTKGVMVSLVGDDKKSVEQRDVPPDEDLTNPEWTRWDDGDPDAEMADIGDSVFFRRPDADGTRVAGIEEGEAIIPGIPLPDMTGEGWQPA